VRVLIVRPAPGNAATADAVAAMGLDPVVVPLFEVSPVAWEVPEPAAFDAVVMTSANAARLGGAGLARFAHLPVFAVGGATGAAAREAGFCDVRIGSGDATDLGAGLPGRVLHLTGADHRPLPTAAQVTAVAVYRSRTIDPPEPLAGEICLIHSPRAGARFADLVPDRSATQIVAISPAAARACGTGWAAVHIAAHQREHAMLATLARVCEAAATN
jgi:uroporphyrinogen-III synthase